MHVLLLNQGHTWGASEVYTCTTLPEFNSTFVQVRQDCEVSIFLDPEEQT